MVPVAPPQTFAPTATYPTTPAGRPSVPQYPGQHLSICTCDLTAEWPIDNRDPDNILLQGETIQQKVLASNLWGDKKAGANAIVGISCSFCYVAVLSDADRKSALANACQQAEKNAALLAEAAKVKVGPLVNLGMHYGYCGPIGSGPMTSIAITTTTILESMEGAVASNSPERQTFTVSVKAAYRLIHPGEKK